MIPVARQVWLHSATSSPAALARRLSMRGRWSVLALLVLTTAVAAFRATAAPVALTVPLLVLVVTASVLESGMFDTTPAFVLFFTLALVAHRVPEGRETP